MTRFLLSCFAVVVVVVVVVVVLVLVVVVVVLVVALVVDVVFLGVWAFLLLYTPPSITILHRLDNMPHDQGMKIPT